ncbi:MAG: hypothetical protein ABIM44_08420 [candidate division WOR-3 bacterium]
MNKLIILIILAIIYFSVIGVLGYIIYEMLMGKYPLIGLLLGIITAACISYWLKDKLDFDPLPKSVSSLLIFAGLVKFLPITLALSILLGALFLFAYIMRLIFPDRERIRVHQPRARKVPSDFINEIRRAMEE